jgi:hypothetical protein
MPLLVQAATPELALTSTPAVKPVALDHAVPPHASDLDVLFLAAELSLASDSGAPVHAATDLLTLPDHAMELDALFHAATDLTALPHAVEPDALSLAATELPLLLAPQASAPDATLVNQTSALPSQSPLSP